MIHNHEVESSILSLATKKSQGTKCQGFFVLKPLSLLKEAKKTKMPKEKRSLCWLFFVKHPQRESLPQAAILPPSRRYGTLRC
jgi:hypothetical protein